MVSLLTHIHPNLLYSSSWGTPLNPVHSKSWLKHLETLSMEFRVLQSPAWTQLPNPISEDSVLPGGLRLWITTPFPLASYLHAFVYLGSLPSASPAVRVLVECGLLGRRHAPSSQSTACPSGLLLHSQLWGGAICVCGPLRWALPGWEKKTVLSTWSQLPARGLVEEVLRMHLLSE